MSGTEHECTKCKTEIIDKQCAVVGDKKYHVECFKCNSCSNALAGQKFNSKEGEVYCEPCHLEKFAPTCAGCSRKIAGKHLTVEDKKFHNDCFVCSSCTTAFGSDGYYMDDGQYSCKKCLTSKRNRECGICKQLIEDEEIFAMEQYFHHECFKCTKCEKPVGETSFINLEGKPFHSACVNSICVVCGIQCDGEYYQVENDNICHVHCIDNYDPKKNTSNPDPVQEKVAEVKQEEQKAPQEEQKEQVVEVKVEEKVYDQVAEKQPEKPVNPAYQLKTMETQDVNQVDATCLETTRVRYTLKELQTNPPPAGVPLNKKELYLSDEEFEKVFKMKLNRFLALKDWKQISLKKQSNLF